MGASYADVLPILPGNENPLLAGEPSEDAAAVPGFGEEGWLSAALSGGALGAADADAVNADAADADEGAPDAPDAANAAGTDAADAVGADEDAPDAVDVNADAPGEDGPSFDAEPSLDNEMALSQTYTPLAIGEMFLDDTDEGRSVRYSITGPDTVQVGHPGYGTVDPTYAGPLTIPSTVTYKETTYRVTAIGSNAFDSGNGIPYYQNYSFTSIYLPDSITTIGNSAFVSCPNLESFTLPSSVTALGERAFAGSTIGEFIFARGNQITSLPADMFSQATLTSFVIPSQITSIGSNAFYRTRGIANLVIPAQVTSIGSGAFRDSDLQSVTIPAVTSLGSNVFYGCSRLQTVTFANEFAYTALPAGTFANCALLTDVTLPSSLTSIGASAFEQSGLVSVTVPAAVTSLGGRAFADCGRLTQVMFEGDNKMLDLPAETFLGCTELVSCTLPSTIRSIGDSAFLGCRALTSFEVPAAVTSLGDFAFQECLALTTLTFRGDASALSSQTSTFYLDNRLTTVIYRGKKARSLSFPSSRPTFYYTLSFYENEAAKDAAVEPLALFVLRANTIPQTASGSAIYEGSLPDPPGPSQRWVYEDGFNPSVVMTDSFYAYARLITVVLEVGDSFTAFTMEQAAVTYEVTALPQGNTPGTVTVGQGTTAAVATDIRGAITLPEYVTAPDAQRYTVTQIAAGAFADCSRFVTITIPATVTSIGAGAFRRCLALRTVYFSSDATRIVDDGIFAGCPAIQQVIFGGKKANISFGMSSPVVYYTVSYYESRQDLQAGNRLAALVVKQRARLDALSADDVRSGSVPSLEAGYDWTYEEGFSARNPLEDSCFVYADGVGFQATIAVLNGSFAQTPCWFKVTGRDETLGIGTVQVGLGINGVPAVYSSTDGIPVIPSEVTDDSGTRYRVTGVGDYAFGSPDKGFLAVCQYIDSVQLPATIVSVGDFAFSTCNRLRSMTIPRSIKTMGRSVFANCPVLSEVLFDPSSDIAELPTYTFENCINLRSITLSEKMRRIGIGAFDDCISLTSVSLPQSLTHIGRHAFFRCGGLTSIEFPVNLVAIDQEAFVECVRIKTMTFLGDAQDLKIGNAAFVFFLDNRSPGMLEKVIFKGKKLADITPYIASNPNGIRNEYGRTYDIYYTVSFYASAQDFEAGVLSSTLPVREDRVPENVPALGGWRAWQCEPGFSLYSRAFDSFYAFSGADIAVAAVSGVREEYSYTGDYIKPEPILTMPDGTVLRPGVDYVFDTSMGANRDGYVNNRRQGNAAIYLLGINGYAGYKIVTFRIAGVLDSAAVMDIRFLDQQTYTYSGFAHTPTVQVYVTFRDETRLAVLGTDYELAYRDNVDADQKRAGRRAQVVVTGKGIYGGTAVATFSIEPFPLMRCDIESSLIVPEGTEEGAEGAEVVPQATVRHIQAGRTLVEGADYQLTYRAARALGNGALYLSGMGNYTGLVQVGLTPSSGDGGGGGGGTGGGIGGGTGPGAGNGTGTGGANDGLSRDALSVGLGPDEAVIQSDSADDPGSAEGGGGNEGVYSLYEISNVAFETVEQTALPSSAEGWPQLAIIACLLIALAAGLRYRNFLHATSG
jgi:hypothetical protein